MIFSSNIFIFLFFPISLAIYFATKVQFRNLCLLLLSCFFYTWGSGLLLLLLLGSVGFNFLLGKCIESSNEIGRRKSFLALAVVSNLAVLIYYKYAGFIVENINDAVHFFHFQNIPFAAAGLPIGISFFTFQAISYNVEVYRRDHPAEKRLIDFGLFLTFFPHLVAGPVVRYSDIAREIKARKSSDGAIFDGISRFSQGLAKKVLIANQMSPIADQIFSTPHSELTTGVAWIGAIAYTFQIYFDFSGYSDMAIGLARFFGFHFPENFNLPYSSTSITEFWRRWHMSLSKWFRDFLYIPLGGNRKGNFRTYFNLFTVFLLCGLWHGASWTFAIWGAYQGVFLILERFFKNKNHEPSGFLGHAYTYLVVIVGWVFFRSIDLQSALFHLQVMFLGNPNVKFVYFNPIFFLNSHQCFYFVLAFVVSTFHFDRLWSPFENFGNRRILFQAVATIFLFLLSITYLSSSGYNPFIYFRF